MPTTIYCYGITDSLVNTSQCFFHAAIAEPFDYDLVFRLIKAQPNSISFYTSYLGKEDLSKELTSQSLRPNTVNI